MTKKLENTKALDVYFTDADGNKLTIDVSTIEYLYFIEDVFSFCITGKMQFVDYGNIIEGGNIWGWGNEKLSILYGVSGNSDILKEFLIHKIDKQRPSSNELHKNNTFEITFVSPLYYKWHFKQYSKSYDEMYTVDIINEIMKNMVGGSFTTIEKSRERMADFYTGLKSPAENVKYLMERSSGVNTKKAGFLCFENVDGYHLVTLSSLMNNTVEVMKPNNNDNDRYWFFSENPYLINKVLSFEREGIDNSSRQQLSGGYRMGYDIMRKKNITQTYTYKGSRKLFKDNMFGDPEYPLLDISITGNERYLKTGENREDFIDNMYYNNWIKQYSIQQTFSISVQGNELRKAGGVIKIRWPSINQDQDNKNFTGKYFVKSVINYFYKDSNPFYGQKLILMKNAYDGKNKL